MADQPTQRRSRGQVPQSPRGGPPGQRPGGGAPARQMPRMPGSRMFWVVVLIALALNYVFVALFASGKERSVTTPYSPTSREQVEKGNVAIFNNEAATAE